MTEEWNDYRYTQARAWLEHVRDLGERVKTAKALVESERELMDGLKAVNYSLDGKPTPNEEAMLDAIAQLQTTIGEYASLLSEHVDTRADAHRRLAGLKDAKEYEALTHRYIQNMAWEEVCVEMAYTWQGMMTLRKRAIIHAYDVMPNNWRDPLHPAI